MKFLAFNHSISQCYKPPPHPHFTYVVEDLARVPFVVLEINRVDSFVIAIVFVATDIVQLKSILSIRHHSHRFFPGYNLHCHHDHCNGRRI
jgi:hypothetical protein